MVILSNSIVKEKATSMKDVEAARNIIKNVYTRIEITEPEENSENKASTLEQHINKKNEELQNLLPILENHGTHFYSTIGNGVTGLKNLLEDKTPKNPFMRLTAYRILNSHIKSDEELGKVLLDRYITESEEYGKDVGTKIYYLEKTMSNSKKLIEDDIKKGISKEAEKGNIDTCVDKLYELLNLWQKENREIRHENEESVNYSYKIAY